MNNLQNGAIFNFQNMKNPKYMFCTEFYSECQLWVLLRWRHYCDVICRPTKNTVCAVICSSVLFTTRPVLNKNEQV